MSEYSYITLREKPELKEYAAKWFHDKWDACFIWLSMI